MLYRICTEDMNQKGIESILNRHYEGYSILKSQGYWKLQKENSLIIEIITKDNEGKEDNTIREIAEEIKEANKQDAVLVQVFNNNQWFI